MTAVLLLDAVTCNGWALSPGPAEMPDRFTVCSPASSRIGAGSGIASSVGGSFTAVTVIVNVCWPEVSSPPLAVPPSSCSSSVMVAVPLTPVAGV